MSFRLSFLDLKHSDEAMACMASSFTPCFLSQAELGEVKEIQDPEERKKALLRMASSRSDGQLTELWQIGGTRALLCTSPTELIPIIRPTVLSSIEQGFALGAFLRGGDAPRDGLQHGGGSSSNGGDGILVACFIGLDFNPTTLINKHKELLEKLEPRAPGSISIFSDPQIAPQTYYYSKLNCEISKQFLSNPSIPKDGPIVNFHMGGVLPHFRAKKLNLIEKLSFQFAVHAFSRGYRYGAALCVHPITHGLFFNGQTRVLVQAKERYCDMEYPFNSGRFPLAPFKFKSPITGADSSAYAGILHLSDIIVHRNWKNIEPLLPWVGLPALIDLKPQQDGANYFSQVIAPLAGKGPYCSTVVEFQDTAFEVAKSIVHPSYQRILQSKL